MPLPLLLLALVASYVQSVTGFALGMIMMAVAGGLGWYPVATLAGVVTLLSFANIAVALPGAWQQVAFPFVRWLVLGQVLAIAPGLWLLYTLEKEAVLVLKALLGAFIAFGSLALARSPTPFDRRSGTPFSMLAGLLGGLVGGLFAAAGPVLSWFMYRQPLPFPQIRASLLYCFLLSTLVRGVLLFFAGLLVPEILSLVALTLPVVLLGSWLGRRFPPPVSERVLKQTAFVLLVVLGFWILGDVLWQLKG